MKTLISFLVIAFLTLTSQATVINVACNWGAITNALLTTAQDGDEIDIASGTTICSNTVTINRNISFTLKGAGSNSTWLVATNLSHVIYQQSTSTKPCIYRDFGFNETVDQTSGFLDLGGNTNSYYCLFNLYCTNVMYRAVQLGVGGAKGGMWKCWFEAPVSGAASFQHLSFQGNGYTSFLEPNPSGTTNQWVVEDCTFLNNDPANGGNGTWDAYDGCSFTVRRCLIGGHGTYTGDHGYDSQTVGCRFMEVYNDIFTNCDLNASVCVARSGGYMFFSNSIYAAGAQTPDSLAPQLQYYRAAFGSYQGTYGYAGWATNIAFGGQPANNSTVHYGGTDVPDYTFVNALTTKNQCLIGASLTATLSNLKALINLGTGSGTVYGTGSDPNPAFICTNSTSTTIALLNRLDGTNAINGTYTTGYPAAFMPSVVSALALTNIGVQQVCCFQWSNTVHTTGGQITNANWSLRYASDGSFPINLVTDIMKEGRDYSNNVPATNYTILPYPLAIRVSVDNGGGGAATFQPAPFR